MEFCQHNTYISLLPTSFFLHVDYLHRVVLWPPMSSLIIMNNIKQKRFIIKLFCTKQARQLYNITCQQENSAENREGKIINQKIYGIWNPPFGFPHLQDRRAGISKNVSTICRSLPFFYAYSTYPRYLVSCVYTCPTSCLRQ